MPQTILQCTSNTDPIPSRLPSLLTPTQQIVSRIQYLFPELSGQRVIQMEARMLESPDGERACSTVTRVGRVEEDDGNVWLLRVSYSPGTQVVYEGRCVPGERDVYVRPATTIDLIYVPLSKAVPVFLLSSS